MKRPVAARIRPPNVGSVKEDAPQEKHKDDRVEKAIVAHIQAGFDPEEDQKSNSRDDRTLKPNQVFTARDDPRLPAGCVCRLTHMDFVRVSRSKIARMDSGRHAM